MPPFGQQSDQIQQLLEMIQGLSGGNAAERFSINAPRPAQSMIPGRANDFASMLARQNPMNDNLRSMPYGLQNAQTRTELPQQATQRYQGVMATPSQPVGQTPVVSNLAANARKTMRY